VISALIMGRPVRRLLNPITRCRDHPRNRYAGTGDGRGTGQKLDSERLTLMSGCIHSPRREPVVDRRTGGRVSREGL